MKRKYTLTRIKKTLDENITLTRIRAEIDFGNVKAGTLGGYVQSVDNLSQKGDCWIADRAMAYGHSRVSQNGLLKDRAVIKDYVCIHGSGVVGGQAFLNQSVHVFDHGTVGAQSFLTGAATVSGNAAVFCTILNGERRYPNMSGLTIITDSARLEERGRLKDSATLRGNTLLRGYGLLRDRVVADGRIVIGGAVRISDDVRLFGTISIGGQSTFRGDVIIYGERGGLKIAGPSLLICKARVYGQGYLYGIKLSGDQFHIATKMTGKEAA